MNSAELLEKYSDYSIVLVEMMNADRTTDFIWNSVYDLSELFSKEHTFFCVMSIDSLLFLIRHNDASLSSLSSFSFNTTYKVFGVTFMVNSDMDANSMLLIDFKGNTVHVNINKQNRILLWT